MGFLFGLLTGIFAFVATLAIVVVHVLKLNLDLSDSKVKNIHNGTSEEAVSAKSNGHDFSSISETRLRQMIQKILAETTSLPPLTNGHAASEIALDRSVRRMDKRTSSNNDFSQRHRTEHYFEPIIYQDLLATAVLNKIVDKQLKNIRNASEIQTVAGEDDLNDNLRDETTDQNLNVEKLSTSSGSSVEPRSDCSYTEVEQIFNNNDDRSSELLRNSDRDSVMSDYLANHMIPLPDLNAMATESEEDDYTSVTSSAVGDGTWEKNWLFKKKKAALSGSIATSSIGMLVPDPKEDVRAQIGDKTADEVSDLSELGSDSDDSLNSLHSQLEPINDRLINKHLIGGQNSKIILDELIDRSSMISNTSPNDAEPIYTDTFNEHIIDAKTKNEAINDNVNQQTQCAMELEVLKDLNSNSLTDQLSPFDGSRTSTVEEYLENGNEDTDLLISNLNNKLTTNTSLITNTNASSETNSKANTNSTKNFIHKQPKTRIPPSQSDQRKPLNSLTSAVQSNGSSLKNTRLFFGDIKNKEKTECYNQYVAVGANNDFVADNDDKHEDDEDNDDDVVPMLQHFVPGSIAEREYKKWYNAVEMPNNPYAPEALKRRISGSQERFIDLPNISPTKDLNPLNLLNEPTIDADDDVKIENNYKWYSRDYYINSSLTAPQISPARDLSTLTAMENREIIASSTKAETGNDVYKAIPAQVVEVSSSGFETTSTEAQAYPLTVSEDSDTLKINETVEERNDKNTDKVNAEEKASCLAFTKSESSGNVVAPTRGSTPPAFKFMQPKRKLLEPNQVLTVDEEGPKVASSQLEKVVIEEEVVKALPSVKALARAFLMTTNSSQPEKLWLRKARTLPQVGKNRASSPKRSIHQLTMLEGHKPEDDITISSDLSSLETDSSSMGAEFATASNSTIPAASSSNDLSSPDPVRQGVLKNNIAFFENLKNK